jgi:nicotinamide N-methyltransferase
MSRFLELHSQQLLKSERKGKGKNVLELGAGGGLPGLVAALEGARQVS